LIDVDEEVAVAGAKNKHERGGALGLVDSIIYSTTKREGAGVVGSDFQGIGGRNLFGSTTKID
jgi:hypothetical protein